MGNSGWDLAMRRIDAEHDIPQFLASSLVRTIASNKFRLPAADRTRFAQLPNDVIARIEQIVLDAYLEAGEDVGGDILRDHLWQQALDSRRGMIANGELLSKTDFRQRLGVTERRLEKLQGDGSIFALAVDEVEYLPAVLADLTHNQKRLQTICRIVALAPTSSRLDFLTSQRGSLGERTPLDMLESDQDFKLLKALAKVWVAEWWRTSVMVYEGKHETKPVDVRPLYAAAAEIDPREGLWERASEALHQHGYQWPLGPFPDVQYFSVFVERQAAGESKPISEACVQINVEGEYLQIRIVTAPDKVLQSAKVSIGNRRDLIEVTKRAIALLLALSALR